MSAYETSLIAKYFGRASMNGMPLFRAAQLLDHAAVGEAASRAPSTAAGTQGYARLALRKPAPLTDADLIKALFNQGPGGVMPAAAETHAGPHKP